MKEIYHLDLPKDKDNEVHLFLLHFTVYSFDICVNQIDKQFVHNTRECLELSLVDFVGSLHLIYSHLLRVLCLFPDTLYICFTQRVASNT